LAGADNAVHHGSEGFARGSRKSRHFNRSGRDFANRYLWQIVVAQRQTSQNISFGKDSGNAVIFIDHGDGSHCRSSMLRMACSAVAVTGTEATSESHNSRIFIASPF